MHECMGGSRYYNGNLREGVREGGTVCFLFLCLWGKGRCVGVLFAQVARAVWLSNVRIIHLRVVRFNSIRFHAAM